MDVKDLRTDNTLSERNNDGSKYSQSGVALPSSRNKSYQDIGSNPLSKTEPTVVRPCAVIGPDRVVPPPATNDAFLKRGAFEPWLGPDSVYRRPPDYPQKLIASSQNPTRNISPRQTFQENMQRIMVPPTYNALRHADDSNYTSNQDRNAAIGKTIKPNVASEAKYCDVPYAINNLTTEPKNVRDAEMYVPSVNPVLTRTTPHGWPPASVNVHPSRTFGAHELYQYSQYSNCGGSRPPVLPMPRHRTMQEEPTYVYPDHYYQDSSARFKPYPNVKDRYPQARYEYLPNYTSQFHPPPPMQPHKYDLSKQGQVHPYPVFPHLKYVDNRVSEHAMEAYPRPTNQPPHYNMQLRNQVLHPSYAPGHANIPQNKLHPYPHEGIINKTVSSNKLTYDSNSKMYIDYENSRAKAYPTSDSYLVNETSRVYPAKNQMVMPNYPPIGVQSMSAQQYHRKDNLHMKPYEYMPHFRNLDPSLNMNPMMRHAPQFSPNTLAISPSESSTSNDTLQTHGISQDDCGYVSQSSAASVRSVDSGLYRLPHEYYKRYDFRYGPIVGSLQTLPKHDLNSNNTNTKETKQKDINVRQFLQMWNEGEEENCENNHSKEIVVQTGSSESTFTKQHSSQDQLYVLGLVNVPSEELSKYEHIQKISKLPENIKGYNNLELLSQFEEAIESSKKPSFKTVTKEYQLPSQINSPQQVFEHLPRPVSPLDVEAKISQSVIHKEVGCNFEIRPCSPKMLNVDVAAPAQNILGERVIEKVSNPLSNVVKSPKPLKPDENSNCHSIKRHENSFPIAENPSCKMRSPYSANNMDSVKTNYTLQDLEINAGVCLASLPQLDNEIELNFPEVNQQFINANRKEDNLITKNNSQNSLEQELGLMDNNQPKTDIKKSDNTHVVEDSEKTYTKLSKYRKLKTIAFEQSGKNLESQAVRTDSVIIKNPENVKNIEDKLLANSLNMPINLSSQPCPWQDLPDKLEENPVASEDIALDFSLNKTTNTNDLPIINIEKEDSSIASLSHKISNDNTSLPNRDNLTNKNTHFDESIIFNNSEITSDYIKSIGDSIDCRDNLPVTRNNAESEFQKDYKMSANVRDSHHSNILLDNDAYSSSLLSLSPTPVNNNVCNVDSQTSNDVKKQEDQLIYFEDSIKSNGNYNSNNTSNKENSAIKQKVVSKSEINDDNRTELEPSTQFEHNLENDEISASLEKMFQDTNDETAISKDCRRVSLHMAISKTLKLKSFYQSKELYSPWIQKLLINSEGVYSDAYDDKQRDTLKSILSGDENINELGENNSNVLHEESTDNMDVDGIDTFKYLSCAVQDQTFNRTTGTLLPGAEDSKVTPDSCVLFHEVNTVTKLGDVDNTQHKSKEPHKDILTEETDSDSSFSKLTTGNFGKNQAVKTVRRDCDDSDSNFVQDSRDEQSHLHSEKNLSLSIKKTKTDTHIHEQDMLSKSIHHNNAENLIQDNFIDTDLDLSNTEKEKIHEQSNILLKNVPDTVDHLTREVENMYCVNVNTKHNEYQDDSSHTSSKSVTDGITDFCNLPNIREKFEEECLPHDEIHENTLKIHCNDKLNFDKYNTETDSNISESYNTSDKSIGNQKEIMFSENVKKSDNNIEKTSLSSDSVAKTKDNQNKDISIENVKQNDDNTEKALDAFESTDKTKGNNTSNTSEISIDNVKRRDDETDKSLESSVNIDDTAENDNDSISIEYVKRCNNDTDKVLESCDSNDKTEEYQNENILIDNMKRCVNDTEKSLELSHSIDKVEEDQNDSTSIENVKICNIDTKKAVDSSDSNDKTVENQNEDISIDNVKRCNNDAEKVLESSDSNNETEENQNENISIDNVKRCNNDAEKALESSDSNDETEENQNKYISIDNVRRCTNDTEKALEPSKSIGETEEIHNDHILIEYVKQCNNDSENALESSDSNDEAKENQDEDIISENVKRCDNDTQDALETLDSIDEPNENQKEISIKNMKRCDNDTGINIKSSDCIDKTAENQNYNISIKNVKRCDDDTEKTSDSSDSIDETEENYDIFIENTKRCDSDTDKALDSPVSVFNTNENQNVDIFIGNVQRCDNDIKTTLELSDGIDKIEEIQNNNILIENFVLRDTERAVDSSVSNDETEENQNEDISIDNVQRCNINAEKTLQSSDIIDESEENQYRTILCKNVEARVFNSNITSSRDCVNQICNLNPIEMAKCSLKSVSNGVTDCCLGQQIEETTNETLTIICNSDEIYETYDGIKIGDEDFVNPHLEDSSNSVSQVFFTEIQSNEEHRNPCALPAEIFESTDTLVTSIQIKHTENKDITIDDNKKDELHNDSDVLVAPLKLTNKNLESNQNVTLDSRSKENGENVSIQDINVVVGEKKQLLHESCKRHTENYCSKENKVNKETFNQSNSSITDIQDITTQDSPIKRKSLKRSYSDSALNRLRYEDYTDKQVMDNSPFIWPSKRQKTYENYTPEEHVINENLCRLIHNNRRNSVSSFYNDDNVSFCILIDNNCIISEENEEDKICYAEISENCINEVNSMDVVDNADELICCSEENELDISESVILNYDHVKSIQDSWLDDVACVETVVSDDIDEDVISSGRDGPRNDDVSVFDESGIFGCDISEQMDDMNCINEEENISENVAQNVEIYRYEDSDEENITNNVSSESEVYNICHKDIENNLNEVHSVLIDTKDEESSLCSNLFKSVSLEKILTESTSSRGSSLSPEYVKTTISPENTRTRTPENKENIYFENMTLQQYENYPDDDVDGENHIVSEDVQLPQPTCSLIQENTSHSCESTNDNIFNIKEQDDDVNYITSSSPEVSSTTSDEKSSSILLKITTYNGSRVSEVNEVKHNKPRCKFTEKKEYSNPNGCFPKRPLITKAAQKYIPPLKESIGDLKVKLTLPHQRLLKLKQLKLARNESQKLHKHTNTILTIPKKPKPNFEDVLKSIDEVQIKMHKEKTKKAKNPVPKLVIKKNLNGSHYSSSHKDTFNPDLTGRKWQPWVFLERNDFIDKMAIRHKTKAIYNHRKNMYVLADKFKKYRSVNNCSAKFVITQPKCNDASKGQLKYTIRLKHTY